MEHKKYKEEYNEAHLLSVCPYNYIYIKSCDNQEKLITYFLIDLTTGKSASTSHSLDRDCDLYNHYGCWDKIKIAIGEDLLEELW